MSDDASNEPHESRWRPSRSPCQALFMAGALSFLASVVAPGCSGKKRDFASGIANPSESVGSEAPDAGGASGPAAPGDIVTVSPGATEGGAMPGALASLDAGQAPVSVPAPSCGDACSGECAPGSAQCASPTERVECGIDARWSQPVGCPNICTEGACAGECRPGTTECATTTRVRTCSDLGSWSEPVDCAAACVGTSCGGECVPTQTRCASTTEVSVCDSQGVWGAPTTCQNACVGGACTGECAPGATRCASETTLQTCNDQGQFLGGIVCPFACIAGACGGECSPGSRRCNPANDVPQFCGNEGLWETQAPCQFTCSGSGTCTGECTPGSRRCDPVSGQPQLCSELFVWQNQGTCPRGCADGTCLPLVDLAGACTGAADCASGFCVAGACCESACAGTNRACVSGQCTCQPGTHDCSGQCLSDTSVASCGSSCIPCPVPANGSATCEEGQCATACEPSFNLCIAGTASSCTSNVFDFENGTLQGWEARTGLVSTPAVCGNADSVCLTAFEVADIGDATGLVATARATIFANSPSRRVAMTVPICLAGGTADLEGRTISAFARAGSQGGIPVGSTFTLALSGLVGPDVVIATANASTDGVGQLTEFRQLAGVVPASATLAGGAAFAHLTLEIPGTFQFSMNFDVDDIRLGD